MFFYLLIVFSAVSSLYTLIWDLKMDWGLFDLAPLNADDQTLLEQMMDQEDGVRNRQGKKSWKRSYSLSLRRPLMSSQSSKKDTKVLIEDTDDEAFS
ncbi:unnamed protein product [Coregonus sp. 'balchen']|nr:unnamed protein product [Coregonus sp. 'balchen']